MIAERTRGVFCFTRENRRSGDAGRAAQPGAAGVPACLDCPQPQCSLFARGAPPPPRTCRAAARPSPRSRVRRAPVLHRWLRPAGGRRLQGATRAGRTRLHVVLCQPYRRPGPQGPPPPPPLCAQQDPCCLRRAGALRARSRPRRAAGAFRRVRAPRVGRGAPRGAHLGRILTRAHQGARPPLPGPHEAPLAHAQPGSGRTPPLPFPRRARRAPRRARPASAPSPRRASSHAPSHAAPRPQVHAQGLWHRAVHLWLYTPDGHVVVQRRAQGAPPPSLPPPRCSPRARAASRAPAACSAAAAAPRARVTRAEERPQARTPFPACGTARLPDTSPQASAPPPSY
jgi:hypothetical protein